MSSDEFDNKENHSFNIHFKNFKHIKIDPKKRSDALDLMQMHLSKVTFYAERIFSNVEKPKFLLSFMMQDDLEIINQLILFNQNVENYYSQKIDIISKYEQNSFIKEQHIINEIHSDTMNNDIERQIKNNSKEIIKLRKILSIFLNKCKEEDLKKIYHSLLKKKDQFEISVVTSLSNIILNQLNPSPSLIQKCTRNYCFLIDKMKTFKEFESNFTIDEARDIWSNLKNILNKIDPKKSNNKEFVNRYSHLLNYASWAIASIELIYNFQVLKEYKELKEKKSIESIENNSEIDPMKNNPFIALHENANENFESIKSLQKEINNLRNSISVQLIINRKQNNNDLFQSLNQNLNVERKNISMLYNNSNKEDYTPSCKEHFNIFSQLAEDDSKSKKCCGIIAFCKKRIKSISL